MTTPLPGELETKLTEFLQMMSPLRDVMASIVEWHTAHDAEHRTLKSEMQKSMDSYHFRLRSLEAASGRGWMGLVRTTLIILLAAGSGYAVRAAVVPATMAAAHHDFAPEKQVLTR
jgi:hypothetical protein